MLPAILDGLTTGMMLQLAIGPVFLFISDISLQGSLPDGLLSVLAVTIADYIYILLAISGAGKLLEKQKIKRTLGIASSLVLVIFGAAMIVPAFIPGGLHRTPAVLTNKSIPVFVFAFILTISNPLSIVFWTGLFSAKAMDNNYTGRELYLFGLSAGSATILFLGSTVLIISSVKFSIPEN